MSQFSFQSNFTCCLETPFNPQSMYYTYLLHGYLGKIPLPKLSYLQLVTFYFSITYFGSLAKKIIKGVCQQCTCNQVKKQTLLV